MTPQGAGDVELEAVAAKIRRLDPDGSRTAQVLRDTLDQLYDGQRSGRYRWDQLHKTEKTHCGTLVEINLHREFDFEDGDKLDYRIAGFDVDCKYSQTLNAWMIPPEAQGHLCLLVWSSDERSEWSMGIIRITPDRLNVGGNRDRKATLNQAGRDSILWFFERAALPPNILLQLDRKLVDKIMGLRFGTQRIYELFRSALGMRIGRAVVATVNQGHDYMKRVRANGGARTVLQPEGILILGQFKSHCAVAQALGVSVPGPGESIPIRVCPAQSPGAGVAEINGKLWRLAKGSDQVVTAPELPDI